MRVIAGTLGGRRLRAPRGSSTRPTSDRVREALFAMLGPIDGALVLDLFAGTGALGIEALSRGARAAVFVERSPRALEVLRANLGALDLAPERAEVRPGDALATLRMAAERGEKYDLVLLDPPYATAHALDAGLSELVPTVLADGGRVVAESDRRAPLELLASGLARERDRRYGDTSITIHRHR